MDSDTLADLKQFIAATVRQEITGVIERIDELEARLDKKIDGVEARLDKKIDKLEEKVDDGFAGVGQAISDLSNNLENRLDNHETRITALEPKPA